MHSHRVVKILVLVIKKCKLVTMYMYLQLDVSMLLYTIMFHSGTAANTKGTAFVVYEDIFDAKNACEHLSGFNVCNRYLVVLYYQPHKV